MGMILRGSSFNEAYAFSSNFFTWSAPEYDVIVVGAGAAGLAAAIEAADKDLKGRRFRKGT